MADALTELRGELAQWTEDFGPPAWPVTIKEWLGLCGRAIKERKWKPVTEKERTGALFALLYKGGVIAFGRWEKRVPPDDDEREGWFGCVPDIGSGDIPLVEPLACFPMPLPKDPTP